MEPIYVLDLTDATATLETVGGKGASLARMARAGLPVPDGFYVTTSAYRQFVRHNQLDQAIQDALKSVDLSQPAGLEAASSAIQSLFIQAEIPGEIAGAIGQAYAALQGAAPAVAVRSSATAEDLPELSFAGQQETYLNLCGVEALLEAVRRCWASLWTGRAIGYRGQHGIVHESVSLAVVVQLLVPAEAAGILFTADPVTGQRDRLVISAAWGLGEAVVGGLVTPDSLQVDKTSGRLLNYQIAEKEVMTVRVNGGTQEQPVPKPLQNASVLSDSQAAGLAHLGLQIEDLYGMPMDIEWALADGEFAILQARPITALPQPAPSPAGAEPPAAKTASGEDLVWTLPDPKGQYMRMSIIDLLPDTVSPLFDSLAIPALLAGMVKVGRILTRSEPALPEGYVIIINSYAYMQSNFSAREWWWMIAHLLPSYPRMFRMMVPYWRNEALPSYQAVIGKWQGIPPQTLTLSELWSGIQELVVAAMDHLATLMYATTGASAGSEGLFTQVYQKMIRREGDPPATTFILGYNTPPIQAEKSLYDLAQWVASDPDLERYVLDTPATELAAQLDDPDSPLRDGFAARLRQHMGQFGHMIYNLDFAKPLPLDDPTPMIKAIKMYLRGQGTNPYERQGSAEKERLLASEAMSGRAKGLRGWAFRKSLRWAQSMAEVREEAIADIGLSYPALRELLHVLGRRLVEAGAVAQVEDIFYLRKDEIEASLQDLDGGRLPACLADTVSQRRAKAAAAGRLTPPPTLPPRKRYLGVKLDGFVAQAESEQQGETLKGVGASAGRVTAPARVLLGPQDFDQMKPGEVLVAAITTPAWTPLFSMASAVVTDIGGPLSHGSIVAREYGIPAVMGTGVATRHIHTGQLITVDGSQGTVFLGDGKP
jgi:pyruvate,water dikinase